MKTVRELRNSIIADQKAIRDGSLDPKKASELNKGNNAIMKSVGLQLRYSKDRKVKPQIGFLNCK